MTDARLQILQMVQDGKVSAEEALRLLDALGQASRPAPGTAAVTRRQTVRVQTTQSRTLDLNTLLDAISRGATGKILEAGEGSDRIEVWLDE